MRNILTVSLPPETMKAIKSAAKKAKKSVSAYIVHLFESHQRLTTEEELWERCQEAEKNFQEGKTMSAASIDELIVEGDKLMNNSKK